jgi:hypothetical protein
VIIFETSIWPPDLSQFVPDLFVALVTGLVVGLVVLWADRILQRRHTHQENLQRMRRIVRETSIGHPFRYDPGSLLPKDPGLRRLSNQVITVDVALAGNWTIVPGWEHLVRIAESRQAMQSAVHELDRILDSTIGVRGVAGLKARVYASVLHYARRDLLIWDPAVLVPEWEALEDEDISAFERLYSDKDFGGVVDRYADARRDMEAWRLAFVATREHLREVNLTGRDLLMLARVGNTRAERQRAWHRAKLLRKHTMSYANLAGQEAYQAANPGGKWFPYEERKAAAHPGLRDPQPEGDYSGA